MKNIIYWIRSIIQVVNGVNPMGLAALTMLVLLTVVSFAWYIVAHAM